MSGTNEIRWARRVTRRQVHRLYLLDSKGIVDEELIDEVGYAMYARCESIRRVTEAHAGRVTCPRCESTLRHTWDKEEPIVCDCGWETTWGAYLKSYQRKQLHGGSGYPAFLAFLDGWPRARTSRDKLLAIDRLIHACHPGGHDRWKGFARPAGVNLIEGTAHEVAAFLDDLAYSDLSTSGLRDTRDEWRSKAHASGWGKSGP